MGKKKSCQEVKVPRPLDAAETRLYSWVEEAVLTQPSVVESDALLEFRRNYPLMEDSGVEGDYVLEAAGPSDRVPFRADFQWDVMTRCRVAVSQLHLNGWGFILSFEKVCLHYGFRPTIRLFFYIYDVHFPPGSYGYISFRARQGRKLFDSYEDSIQEFKWHYFKVLAASGKRAFWMNHENKPFPWVYWNPEVKDFVVYNLEPLEMAAFKFLVSLPSGLPKRNKFTCRFILDSSDAEVGKYLDGLLDVKMKRTKLDNLMAKMADPSMGGPSTTATAAAVAAAAASASTAACTSVLAAAGSPRVESSTRVPPALTASETVKAKKQSSKRERAKVVDLEEELKEDPADDLQRQRQRKKPKTDEAFEKALGDDSTWEHEVDPLMVAFPEDFNFRKALNAGLSSVPVREALTKMPPEQLLGESYHLYAKSLACLQVGVETSLAAKIKAEIELSAALDQIEILKGERDSALSYLPFKEKADTLKDELSEKSLEHESALGRIAQLEEDNRVLKTQFESSQLSLETERKRAVAVEGQADLSKATEASEYWRSEWHTLGSEGRRIFVLQESEVEGELPPAKEVVLEQHPESTAQALQLAAGDTAGEATGVSGGCPT
ncbi:hypothetical protein PIB30_036325 [Stylosanthes scabra]|uniref:Transposase (Putative), gypsy type n=1 Tax=Stylosanthes scabra TaxID=79078 RepID=A0ABU6UDM5_9FABA|nr:hypothetical protein [Stylosanthes scabra]